MRISSVAGVILGQASGKATPTLLSCHGRKAACIVHAGKAIIKASTPVARVQRRLTEWQRAQIAARAATPSSSTAAETSMPRHWTTTGDGAHSDEALDGIALSLDHCSWRAVEARFFEGRAACAMEQMF
jgi:hypothetical protein